MRLNNTIVIMASFEWALRQIISLDNTSICTERRKPVRLSFKTVAFTRNTRRMEATGSVHSKHTLWEILIVAFIINSSSLPLSLKFLSCSIFWLRNQQKNLFMNWLVVC